MKRSVKRYIMHLLYPTRCPVCRSFIGHMDGFCDNCRRSISPYQGSFTVSGSAGYTAAFVYDEKISPAIILLKNGICGNAAYALGDALADRLKNNGISDCCDIIIPVPLYKKDKRRRGYNQSELIAKELSEQLGISLCSDAIIKLKETSAQKSLSKKERMTNLNGAFSAIRPDIISGKRILLVDDVCTTGSTLTELTKLLNENGAKAVYCASCCKTPPPSEKIQEAF